MLIETLIGPETASQEPSSSTAKRARVERDASDITAELVMRRWSWTGAVLIAICADANDLAAHLLTTTPVRQAIAVDTDPASHLAEANRTQQSGGMTERADVLLADPAARADEVLALVGDLSRNNGTDTVVLYARDAFDPMHRSSRSLAEFVARLVRLDRGLNLLTVAEECCFPDGLPERVLLSTSCLPYNLAKLARAVRTAHPDAFRVRTPIRVTRDAVEMDSRLAVECIAKIADPATPTPGLTQVSCALSSNEFNRLFADEFGQSNCRTEPVFAETAGLRWRDRGIVVRNLSHRPLGKLDIRLRTVSARAATLGSPTRMASQGVRDARKDLSAQVGIDPASLAVVPDDLVVLIESRMSQLAEAAMRDDLTGVYRRNAGLEALRREILRVLRRPEASLVVVFIDIVHLKEVNDSRGHSAGDRLVLELAASLKEELRGSDIVMRWAGDEFVCGLLDASLDQAAKIMARVAGEYSARTGHQFATGFAALDGEERAESIVARADMDLYGKRSRSDR